MTNRSEGDVIPRSLELHGSPKAEIAPKYRYRLRASSSSHLLHIPIYEHHE